jgi:hypothetical protein
LGKLATWTNQLRLGVGALVLRENHVEDVKRRVDFQKKAAKPTCGLLHTYQL